MQRSISEGLIRRSIALLRKGYICNRCLGRQFKTTVYGNDNEEIGRIIRDNIKQLITSAVNLGIDAINLHQGFGIKDSSCLICKGLFRQVDNIVSRILGGIRDYEFERYTLGLILPSDLVKNEEELLSEIGPPFHQTLKSELKHELRQRISNVTGKEHNNEDFDIAITVDLPRNSILVHSKSIFIYGEYMKLVRGIPQCRWMCRECSGNGCEACNGKGKRYRTSVQEIIERPFLRATNSAGSKLHASGREDVDVRCLAFRPFIIELIEPKKRSLDLPLIMLEINRSSWVKVRGLRFSSKKEVKYLKAFNLDKTYRAIVHFSKPIELPRLNLLSQLVGKVVQRTPKRVIHRRADKIRVRRVKELSYSIIGKSSLELIIKAESGLYIKEFITGDSGRTVPSLASLLGVSIKDLKLDVIGIGSDHSIVAKRKDLLSAHY